MYKSGDVHKTSGKLQYKMAKFEIELGGIFPLTVLGWDKALNNKNQIYLTSYYNIQLKVIFNLEYFLAYI